ncbi:MAG: hypothetical protein AB8B56_02365 [Crocinitomicaceae bacterium]
MSFLWKLVLERILQPQSVSLSIKSLVKIFLIVLHGVAFGQNDIYDRSPEFIKKFGIKRMVQMRNTSYHVEQGIEPDSSQMEEFSEEGAKMFSTSYFENERYYWNNITLDGQSRTIRDERFNREGLHGVSDYNYLPNGDYIVRYYATKNPDRVSLYKYFFDPNGNEVRREEWSKDSSIVNKDIKTYNEHNLILSRVHQRRNEDTVMHSEYHYKKDSILLRKNFYSKGELSMRTKYEYFPDGKEKVVHYGKQSSWHSFYNDLGQLSKQKIIQHDRKDTVENWFKYNEHGLVSVVSNERKDYQQRREVYTYLDGKETTKTIYVRANTLNALLETVYLGDTALVIYQTPYWENRASHAEYKRIDAYGNVLEELKGRVKGKKQALDRWMKDIQPTQYAYTVSKTGKVLEKYARHKGWEAEKCLCPTYTDEVITHLVGRRSEKRKNASCDTIRTRRYEGGKHYFVSMHGAPNLVRHIYQGKSGEVDSILDINKSGAVINRMIMENGVRISHALINRYEYNELDSIQRVYKCFQTRSYSLSENMTEEYFWEGERKVKAVKFYNNWNQYSRKDTTTITYEYKDGCVFRTTNDRLGKTSLHRLKYDENNHLTQLRKLDRQSSGNLEVNFTYDQYGNLLERSEVIVARPVETLFRYEFY